MMPSFTHPTQSEMPTMMRSVRGPAQRAVPTIMPSFAVPAHKGAAGADFFDPTYGIHREGIVTVDLAVDPELRSTFCRRGRQRLRAIQASCQAMVRLDRSRGVMRVTGTEAAVEAVKRQLASLSGPRRAVSAPVWAELMRTRTMTENPQASVARLQAESGCRIHIERSRQEVRLFGPDESVALADRLLEGLAEGCTEESVSVGPGCHLNSPSLQALAQQCGITLRIEEGQISVLGLRDAVAPAVAELRKYASDPEAYQPPKGSTPAPKGYADGAWSPAEERLGAWCDEEDEDSGSPRGFMTSNMPPPAQPRAAKAHGDRAAAGPVQGGCCAASCEACPTCGAARFCVFCGAQTGRSERWQEVESVRTQQHGGHGQRHSRSMRNSQQSGSWDGGGAGNASVSGTPADAERANWLGQMQFMPYEGAGRVVAGSPGGSAGGRTGAAVPQGMVPVCFPANMAGSPTWEVHNGGRAGMSSSSTISAANSSMMQACMVPASMVQSMMGPPDNGNNSNNNNMAFCAMPAPYYMHDSGCLGA